MGEMDTLAPPNGRLGKHLCQKMRYGIEGGVVPSLAAAGVRTDERRPCRARPSFAPTRDGGFFGGTLARLRAAAGLEDAPLTQVNSLTAQLRLVEAGLGLGLLPLPRLARLPVYGALQSGAGSVFSSSSRAFKAGEGVVARG